jgi:hypothetical protein
MRRYREHLKPIVVFKILLNILFIYSSVLDTEYSLLSMTTLKRIFDVIVLVFCSSSCLVSLITLILIFIRVRPLLSSVPVLLTCNTYITVAGSSFMTLLIMIYSMYTELNPSVLFDDYYCQIRSYVNYVFISGFYYSCALQAVFRLCRVVFPKYKILQSRPVFIMVIIMQWLIASFYILAYLLSKDFEYQPDIGSCWLSFKNIRALSIAMAFVYGSPLIVMGLVYAFIIRYVRQTIQTQQRRQNANKRDLLIVKRIIILVLIAMGIGIPTAFLLIIYIITKDLTSMAYHIQALSLTTGLVIESVALGLITPKVRKLFQVDRRRVEPVMALRVVP